MNVLDGGRCIFATAFSFFIGLLNMQLGIRALELMQGRALFMAVILLLLLSMLVLISCVASFFMLARFFFLTKSLLFYMVAMTRDD
jgi:hypothetical protein